MTVVFGDLLSFMAGKGAEKWLGNVTSVSSGTISFMSDASALTSKLFVYTEAADSLWRSVRYPATQLRPGTRLDLVVSYLLSVKWPRAQLIVYCQRKGNYTEHKIKIQIVFSYDYADLKTITLYFKECTSTKIYVHIILYQTVPVSMLIIYIQYNLNVCNRP